MARGSAPFEDCTELKTFYIHSQTIVGTYLVGESTNYCEFLVGCSPTSMYIRADIDTTGATYLLNKFTNVENVDGVPTDVDNDGYILYQAA